MKVTGLSLPSPKAGFTLIELLVTTAITSIILLTASTILMTFFLSNTRTSIRKQLKSEGNRALSRIEFVARGARECSNPPGGANDLVLETLEGDTVTLTVVGTTINMSTVLADGPPHPPNEQLLSSTAQLQGTTTLNCQGTPPDKQYVDVRFILTNSDSATVEESFNLLTVLRNSGT